MTHGLETRDHVYLAAHVPLRDSLSHHTPIAPADWRCCVWGMTTRWRSGCARGRAPCSAFNGHRSPGRPRHCA
jgi:hypothetical protein